MLKWCLKEARANNLKPDAYMGGFILDEMKVQVGNLLLLLIFIHFVEPARLQYPSPQPTVCPNWEHGSVNVGLGEG